MPLSGLVGQVLEALRIGTGFLWTAAWGIIAGLIITSWVQVYVSKERMASLLGDETPGGLAKATGFGAASSGCSFGATAIGKGLFKKGAHPVNVLAFMFASTNLIVELGLMIWLLLGWEFLLAELLGGLVLIVIMALLVHVTLPEALWEQAREAMRRRDAANAVSEDPTCGMEGTPEHTVEVDGEQVQFCSEGCKETFEQRREGTASFADEITSWGGWYKLGNQYRKEISMLYKDVIAGFLIAGFVIVFVPDVVWQTLFFAGDSVLASAQNALMGVAIAVISFVGSIGNVPFAVALWTGGIGFAGVIAFVYADLITIPVLNVYRKYYGWRVMAYILAVFFVTMAASGFLMEQLFDLVGIVPSLAGGLTATQQDYFSLDYTFYLNLVAFGLSAGLYIAYRRGLAQLEGARDPICGMRTQPGAPTIQVQGETYAFCSEGCRDRFYEDPERYLAQADGA